MSTFLEDIYYKASPAICFFPSKIAPSLHTRKLRSGQMSPVNSCPTVFSLLFHYYVRGGVDNWQRQRINHCEMHGERKDSIYQFCSNWMHEQWSSTFPPQLQPIALVHWKDTGTVQEKKSRGGEKRRAHPHAKKKKNLLPIHQKSLRVLLFCGWLSFLSIIAVLFFFLSSQMFIIVFCPVGYNNCGAILTYVIRWEQICRRRERWYLMLKMSVGNKSRQECC